jgi:integral membrane protein
VTSALARYRAVAYAVGLGLAVLVFVGMPLKYAADQKAVVATVGPLHGLLFIVYLLATADLARRCRWSLTRTALIMLAGTVPLMSFVAERDVTRRVRAAIAAGQGMTAPVAPAPRART